MFTQMNLFSKCYCNGNTLRHTWTLSLTFFRIFRNWSGHRWNRIVVQWWCYNCATWLIMLKFFLIFLYGSLAFYFNSEGIPVPYGFGDITLLICSSSATEGVNPGGGGGYFHRVCILGMCRKRDPHFQPWISVPEHIIFTNYQKIRFGALPFNIFWRILPFRRPSFSNFL